MRGLSMIGPAKEVAEPNMLVEVGEATVVMVVSGMTASSVAMAAICAGRHAPRLR